MLAPTPGPEGAPSPTLAMEINAATRTLHTELNHLITRRLPLALPPCAPSPVLYGKGLVAFSRIFFVFETEWALLLRQVERSGSHDEQVREWLAELRPSGLARSERLRKDVLHLRHVAGSAIFRTPGLGGKWEQDLRLRFRQKPHTLIAFAWVMYMATFSGGRWVRQQLASPGRRFWTGQQPPSERKVGLEKSEPDFSLDWPGFSFLSFEGGEDGEDIKTEFKSRLADAEILLTPEERQDVVATARLIFERCIALVKELDHTIYRQKVLEWVLMGALVMAVLSLLFVLYYFDTFGYLR